MSFKPLAGSFAGLLGMLLIMLTSCRANPTPNTLTPLASPSQVLNTVESFEVALEGAAVTFERLGPVEVSSSWQGQNYLVNGQRLAVLQASPSLDDDQVAAAFSSFAAGLNPPVHFWRQQRLGVFYPGSQGGVVLLVNGLLGDPQRLQAIVQDEPFPPAVLAAIQRISQESGLPPTEFQVTSFERVTWPDSCLGLPQVDEGCLEVLVDGWLVRLKAGDQFWQVHTDEFGQQVRSSEH